jgi:MoaA/NifB/PqqE/SkfB family radical SAM enzyme
MFNITKIWNNCHSHLKPFKNHLYLPATEYVNCSVCNCDKAITVVAKIHLGDGLWSNNTPVIYCPDCDSFSLSDNYASLNITAINAKLWFNTPTVLVIEPTTRCNFDCWYCVGRSLKQEDMSLETFETVINNFPQLKILALVGEGEAIMNKQFFQMVKFAKSKGLIVLMMSNGSTLSKSVVQNLCEQDIDYICISIDSTNQKTFADSRCKGDLDRVWKGIKLLRDYRDNNGYHKPIISIKGTLFKHTLHELIPIVLEAKQHGADVFESFQPLNPKSSYVKRYPKDKQSWIADYNFVMKQIQNTMIFAKQILPLATEVTLKRGFDLANNGQSNGIRPNCDEEWIFTRVTGDVIPCCYIKEPINDTSNLNKFSIDEIKYHQQYENMRFNLWNGIFLNSCEGCEKTLS